MLIPYIHIFKHFKYQRRFNLNYNDGMICDLRGISAPKRKKSLSTNVGYLEKVQNF